MPAQPRHLIHIGFPKAGSTALAAWFAAHPRLAFAHDGIAGHRGAFALAASAVSQRGPDPDWHVTSSESLSAPRLSDAPVLRDLADREREKPPEVNRAQVCRTLERAFSGASILIVTRGFRSQIGSMYSQYVRTGGRLPASALYGAKAEGLAAFLDYDAVVAGYEAAFGADRVIVLPYELLREDRQGFAAAVEQALGIEGGPPIPALNRSLSPAALHWYPAFSARLAPAAERLGPRVGGRLWAAWVRLIFNDRLAGPAALAQRLAPQRHVTAADIPDAVIEACRGRAVRLATRAAHRAYAADYLEDGLRPGRAPVTNVAPS